MATLRVASNHIGITGPLDYGHLQVVLVNGSSQLEIEVQAPLSGFFGSWQYPAIRDHTSKSNTPYYGEDGNYAYSNIDLGERSAENVWNILTQVRSQFAAQGGDIEYDFNKNSNSFINSILYTVGIDGVSYSTRVKAENISSFPGVSTNALLTSRDAISLNLVGTDESDFIRTGVQNDFLKGGKGDDKLFGGEGNDTAIYDGKAVDYKIVHNKDNTYTVSHVRGEMTDGADTLTSIEQVKFSDQGFALAKNSVRTQTDFALIVDTTGSMSSYINAVKAQMANLVELALNGNTMDARISIVGFKDPGETQTILSFTDQNDLSARKAAAISAINSIGVSGGGDIPEGDNSGLLHALKGNAGEFRDTAVARRVAIFTDAPVKDTYLADEVRRYASDIGVIISGLSTIETARGSLTSVEFEALDDGSIPAPVQIFSILVGFDSSAESSVRALAEENGGKFFDADNLTELTDALFEIISAPVNIAPVIGSNGGSDIATLTLSEGSIIVTTVTATDADTATVIRYGIAGGSDAALFTIDSDTGKLTFLSAPDFENPADSGGDNIYDVIVTASDGLIIDTQTLGITVTDVDESDGGAIILLGTAAADQYRLLDDGPRPTGINLFGHNDTLVLDQALSDSNKDRIITFGGNKLLNLTDSGTLDVAGINPAEGLRYIGEKGGEFFYADAIIKPKGAIEGTVGNDALRGTSGKDVFFFDTALGVGLGKDTITGFEAGDRIVTTSAIFDGNDDGKIGLGGNKLLELPDSDGGAGPAGGTISLFGALGKAVTALDFLGSSVENDVTYYMYSVHGDTTSAPAMVF